MRTILASLSFRLLPLSLFSFACSSPSTGGPVSSNIAVDMATTCQADAPCTPTNACHVGRLDCSQDPPACVDTGDLAPNQPGCGPLAYWPFDGDGRDVSAGRNLTLVGNPGFAQGLFGQALDLKGDGSTYAVRRQDTMDINDTVFDLGDIDFTVQVWVAYHSVDLEQMYIDKFTGTDGPGWRFTKLSDQRVHACIQQSGCGSLSSKPQVFTPEQWNHVLLRKSTSYELFLNGQMIASAATPPTLPSPNALYLGRANPGDGRVFPLNGRIDEVAIWKRALSSEEITYLYNNGTGRKASSVN